MSKKLRLIKVNIYARHDQFDALEGTDFGELQESLKNFVSKRGGGKDCVSIVRVLPTLAAENTVDVELVTFNEDLNLVNDTNAAEGIRDILDSYLDIDIGYISITQNTEAYIIFGDLE